MKGSTGLLPLFETDSISTETSAQPLPRSVRDELWLAIYLPKISLEIVAGEHREKPAAVVIQKNGRDIIHTSSRPAEKAGVRKGERLSAAYALCPRLEVYRLDEAAREERLQLLAAAMQRFTSRVVVCSNNALLLEVGSSIAYFGSLETIQAGICEQLSAVHRHYFYIATSPSPAASLLLARSGSSAVVCKRESLKSALGAIPVDYLPLPAKHKQRLENSGVRVLRDLWRLPGAQLARRFGVDLVDYLARVTGQMVDPRESFQTSPTFECSEDFLYEMTDMDQISACAYELLQSLGQFLRSTDLGISHFTIRLFHAGELATSLRIGMRTGGREEAHFFALLQTRLENFVLPAPVISVQLLADQFIPYHCQSDTLLSVNGHDAAAGSASIDALIEQLQARLGNDAVVGLSALADHRPEQASRYEPLFITEKVQSAPPRPFWLLEESQCLSPGNSPFYKKKPPDRYR